MSKLNIVPAIVFAPFQAALGNYFGKVCNDAKSFLGRLEKDIKTTGGEWKVTDKGTLKSKDGNEVQMPLNNPLSILIRFGMQLNEIARKGAFGGEFKLNEAKTEVDFIGIEASLPKECQAWFDAMVKDAKQAKSEVPA